jgi:signal peptidase I
MDESTAFDGDDGLNRKPSESKPFVGIGYLLPRLLRELAVAVLPAVFLALFINVYVTQAMMVQQHSMEPTLIENERVLVEKLTYRFLHGPRRGDIVMFDMRDGEIPLVKRVVALSGETVAVHDGRVFIGGQLVEEWWNVPRGGRDYPPTLVPPLHIFVMGDNRGQSHDSRAFGPVPIDAVIGRIWFVYWPPDRVGRPRAR